MAIEIKMFTSPTCGPCKMMKPIVEKVASNGGYTLSKHCIVENPELAAAEEVSFVPTVKIYKDGELKETFIGIKSEKMITDCIIGME